MTAYSDEQREEALRVYVDDGPDEAEKATGISVRTIYRWASAAGVSTTAISEKTQAATTAAKQRAAMVRAEVGALLIEQAAKALHSMDELQPHKVTVIEGKTRSESFEMIPAAATDKKDLAITAATLIDKYRLEVGEATGRTEHRDLMHDYDDHERATLKQILTQELAERQDPGNDQGFGLDAAIASDPA